MTASAPSPQTPPAPPAFDCKGGSTTRFMLAMAKGILDIRAMVAGQLALPDSNKALRQSAILSARIANMAEKFVDRVELQINHSLDFIESIQVKFRELGTTAAKGNSETLTSQTAALIQQAAALNARRAALIEDLEKIREQFEKSRTLLRTTPDNLQVLAELTALGGGVRHIASKLQQLRGEQQILANTLEGAKKTGVALLPEQVQNFFNTRLEPPREISGPT